jgi:hypothetical protein
LFAEIVLNKIITVLKYALSNPMKDLTTLALKIRWEKALRRQLGMF